MEAAQAEVGRALAGGAYAEGPPAIDDPDLALSALLLDDRAVVALLCGERLPITKGAQHYTTTYFWY